MIFLYFFHFMMYSKIFSRNFFLKIRFTIHWRFSFTIIDFETLNVIFQSKSFFLICSKWIIEITKCIFIKLEKFNSYVKFSIFFLIENGSNFLTDKKLNFEKWYSIYFCFVIFKYIFSFNSKNRCFLFQKTVIRICVIWTTSITSLRICFFVFRKFIFLSNKFLRRIFISWLRNFTS